MILRIGIGSIAAEIPATRTRPHRASRAAAPGSTPRPLPARRSSSALPPANPDPSPSPSPSLSPSRGRRCDQRRGVQGDRQPGPPPEEAAPCQPSHVTPDRPERVPGRGRTGETLDGGVPPIPMSDRGTVTAGSSASASTTRQVERARSRSTCRPTPGVPQPMADRSGRPALIPRSVRRRPGRRTGGRDRRGGPVGDGGRARAAASRIAAYRVGTSPCGPSRPGPTPGAPRHPTEVRAPVRRGRTRFTWAGRTAALHLGITFGAVSFADRPARGRRGYRGRDTGGTTPAICPSASCRRCLSRRTRPIPDRTSSSGRSRRATKFEGDSARNERGGGDNPRIELPRVEVPGIPGRMSGTGRPSWPVPSASRASMKERQSGQRSSGRLARARATIGRSGSGRPSRSGSL